ncbi:MAG: alpha/beta hydrolase-fold protein [Pontixanthobacter sp.]
MNEKSICIAAILAVFAATLSSPVLADLGVGTPVTIGKSYSIPAAAFDGERRITVRLPPGYVEQPEMRFPVVYIIDGGPEQDFPHIAGIVQSRDMNYSFDRFILVGIETINRRSELSPQVRTGAEDYYKELLGATPGGADNFRSFIEADVKPWVEGNFRTTGHSAIMGESLAGLFVLETLLKQPALFDDWIAVSPSLWYDDMKLAREAADRLGSLTAGDERVYLSVANEGYRHEEGVERFVDSLRASAPASLQWAYVPLDASETHGTIYHTAALDAFRLLYGTTDREYRPHGEMLDGSLSGNDADQVLPEEQALLDAECNTQNSLRLTPGAAKMGRERLFYRCLRLDLGPVAREGTLGQ